MSKLWINPRRQVQGQDVFAVWQMENMDKKVQENTSSRLGCGPNLTLFK